MSNVNFTGTALPEDTATATLGAQGVFHKTTNNGYTATILSSTNAHPGQVILTKSGAAVVGPVSQSEIKALWQDLADLGPDR